MKDLLERRLLEVFNAFRRRLIINIQIGDVKLIEGDLLDSV